jgi:hypothetical protein
MGLFHWKAGTAGFYFDPANWVEGITPGVGDVAVVAGDSGPDFFPPGVDPNFLSNAGIPAPPGDTITGQTIDFVPPATAGSNVAQFSNTTFAADTTINVAGPGTQGIVAWYDSNFLGTINIGSPTAPGALAITLVHRATFSQLPATSRPTAERSP